MNSSKGHDEQNNHGETSCVLRKPLPLITPRSSASFSGIFRRRVSILPFRHYFPFLLIYAIYPRCSHLINLDVILYNVLYKTTIVINFMLEFDAIFL